MYKVDTAYETAYIVKYNWSCKLWFECNGHVWWTHYYYGLTNSKTETNDENWNLIAWQQLTKQQESNAILQEVQDLNDTLLELTMRLWFF